MVIAIWLVVWNMNFPIGNFIILTDEVHDFSEGLVPQSPTSLLSRVIWDNYTLMVNY